METFWHWSKVIDPLETPAAFDGELRERLDVIVQSSAARCPRPLSAFRTSNFWKVSPLAHNDGPRPGATRSTPPGAATSAGGDRHQASRPQVRRDEWYGTTCWAGCRSNFCTGPRAWTSPGIGPVTDDAARDCPAPRISSWTTDRESQLAVPCARRRHPGHGEVIHQPDFSPGA